MAFSSSKEFNYPVASKCSFKTLENPKTTSSHSTLTAESVRSLSQSDRSICISVQVEFYLSCLVLKWCTRKSFPESTLAGQQLLQFIQFNPGYLNNTTLSEVASHSCANFSWLFRTYERYILKSLLHWSLRHVKLINPAPRYAYFFLRRDDKTRFAESTSLLLTEVQVRRTPSSTFLKWKHSFTPVKQLFPLHFLSFFFFWGNSTVLSSFRKELFQDWLVNGG